MQEHLLVQVHGDISPELFWVVRKYLQDITVMFQESDAKVPNGRPAKMQSTKPHLAGIYPVVDTPNSLEVILHLLLQLLRHRVHCGELLQVAPLRVVL